MKKHSIRLPLLVALSVIAGTVNAQNTPEHTLPKPPAGIVIDGNLSEWGDSLRYYNEAQHINYALSNDRQNLYAAVRINERGQQNRVLSNGLTLSINTRGKKKETYTITFPVGNEESSLQQLAARPADNTDLSKTGDDEIMKAQLAKLKSIRVTGFKNIESETMTNANTYGFKIAVSYNEDGYLLYEAQIPLKFFDQDDLNKSEWAFNFKINGLKQPDNKNTDSPDMAMQSGGRSGRGGMGGGRGGMGGGRGMGGGNRGGMGGGRQGSSSRGDTFKSVDFWDKFYLAK